jgi:hypothetical protein
MAKNTIKVKNYSDVFEELVAAGTITPGMLVEIDANGKVQAHSTAGGNAAPMFAVEDELQGNGIADDYSAADQVQVWSPGRGDMVYALLADGENAAIGNYLESDGNGKLQVHSPSSEGAEYPLGPIAIAREAVDMSGSSAADPDGRIIVQIV